MFESFYTLFYTLVITLLFSLIWETEESSSIVPKVLLLQDYKTWGMTTKKITTSSTTNSGTYKLPGLDNQFGTTTVFPYPFSSIDLVTGRGGGFRVIPYHLQKRWARRHPSIFSLLPSLPSVSFITTPNVGTSIFLDEKNNPSYYLSSSTKLSSTYHLPPFQHLSNLSLFARSSGSFYPPPANPSDPYVEEHPSSPLLEEWHPSFPPYNLPFRFLPIVFSSDSYETVPLHLGQVETLTIPYNSTVGIAAEFNTLPVECYDSEFVQQLLKNKWEQEDDEVGNITHEEEEEEFGKKNPDVSNHETFNKTKEEIFNDRLLQYKKRAGAIDYVIKGHYVDKKVMNKAVETTLRYFDHQLVVRLPCLPFPPSDTGGSMLVRKQATTEQGVSHYFGICFILKERRELLPIGVYVEVVEKIIGKEALFVRFIVRGRMVLHQVTNADVFITTKVGKYTDIPKPLSGRVLTKNPQTNMNKLEELYKVHEDCRQLDISLSSRVIRDGQIEVEKPWLMPPELLANTLYGKNTTVLPHVSDGQLVNVDQMSNNGTLPSYLEHGHHAAGNERNRVVAPAPALEGSDDTQRNEKKREWIDKLLVSSDRKSSPSLSNLLMSSLSTPPLPIAARRHPASSAQPPPPKEPPPKTLLDLTHLKDMVRHVDSLENSLTHALQTYGEIDQESMRYCQLLSFAAAKYYLTNLERFKILALRDAEQRCLYALGRLKERKRQFRVALKADSHRIASVLEGIIEANNESHLKLTFELQKAGLLTNNRDLREMDQLDRKEQSKHITSIVPAASTPAVNMTTTSRSVFDEQPSSGVYRVELRKEGRPGRIIKQEDTSQN